MDTIQLKAPAKLNLALDILGTTPNGYHTVDMIMQTVSLYDILTLQKSDEYSLQVSDPKIPTDGSNTATKAAKLFFSRTNIQGNVSVSIEKHIPERAGMAGGSADAAAMLVGLNHLFKANLSTKQLCLLGEQIGADVPFSLIGGTARVTGIGEILSPLPSLPSCWFTIAMPSLGNSTPEAYARYDAVGTPIHPNIEQMISAIGKKNLSAMVNNMGNALEFANSNEETAQIHALLKEKNTLASMMTGSGAAVFGIFESKEEAEHAANSFQSLSMSTFVVTPITHGVVIGN